MRPQRREQIFQTPTTVRSLPPVANERGTPIERERHGKARKLVDLASGIITQKTREQGNSYAEGSIRTAVQHLRMAREHASHMTNAALQTPVVEEIFNLYKKLHGDGHLKNLNGARNTADLALNPKTAQRLKALVKKK